MGKSAKKQAAAPSSSTPGMRLLTQAAPALIATAVTLIFLAPVWPLVARLGMNWPIRLTHNDAVRLSTYGKWFFTGPHTYLTDSFAGTFPTFYNVLSDMGLNLFSLLVGWPQMTVQAVIWGPLCVFMLVFFTYRGLHAVTGDRIVATIASVLVALGANARLGNLLGLPDHNVDGLVHVPLHAAALATGQSMGWAIYMPTLCAFFVARERFSKRTAVFAGLWLGLLFNVHTLSFLNTAAITLTYVTVDLAITRKTHARWKLWLVVQTAAFAAFILAAAVGTSGTMMLVPLLVIGACDFFFDDNKPFYYWTFGSAALLAFPFAFRLATAASVPSFHGGRLTQTEVYIGVIDALCFYSAYLVGAGIAVWKFRDHAVMRWVLSMAGATAFMGFNHLTGLANHPYRFVINLIFPLSVLAAIGLRRAPKAALIPLAAWFIFIVSSGALRTLNGPRIYANYFALSAKDDAFLRQVATVTADPSLADTMILNAPELTEAAIVFNYSKLPGFIPDYSYATDRKHFDNRIRQYCYLFPVANRYAARTEYMDGCPSAHEAPADVVRLRDNRLKSQLLSAYGVGLAIAHGQPFASLLQNAGPTYGWKPLGMTEQAAMFDLRLPQLPGVAHLGRPQYAGDGLSVPFEAADAEPAWVVVARSGSGADTATIDGTVLSKLKSGNDWTVYDANVSRGAHKLQLGWKVDGAQHTDSVFFLAVVSKSHAGEYLDLE